MAPNLAKSTVEYIHDMISSGELTTYQLHYFLLALAEKWVEKIDIFLAAKYLNAPRIKARPENRVCSQ
jgi:anthranilate phosphoribosyltransferase